MDNSTFCLLDMATDSLYQYIMTSRRSEMQKPEVTTWHAHSNNGRHIASTWTMVRFADGREVRFMGKLGKREAIRQAAAVK